MTTPRTTGDSKEIGSLSYGPVDLALAAEMKLSSITGNEKAEGIYDGTQAIGLVELNSILKKSVLKDIKAVIKEFNKDVKDSALVNTNLTARKRIQFGHVTLVHRNQIPELGIDEGSTSRRAWSLFDKIERVGHYDINKLIYGKYGKYVLNVPFNHYALVESTNPEKPFTIYDGGSHVIEDKKFVDLQADPKEERLDAKVKLVNKAAPYINLGMYHVLSVPVNHFAKVLIGPGRIPLLLPYREQPYVIEDRFFELVYDKDPKNAANPQRYFVHEATPYIHHGSIHRLLIPYAHLVKVWDGPGRIPELLEWTGKPVIRNSMNFAVANPQNPFESVYQEYINHDNVMHIFNIPPNYVATILDGNKGKVLESQVNPHKFLNHPSLRLIKDPKGENFRNAGLLYLRVGNETRIRVPDGYIGVVRRNGTIAEFLEPKKEPHTFIDDALELVRPKYEKNVGVADVKAVSTSTRIIDTDADQDPNVLFYKSDSKLIEVGALKRVLPPLGTVAVTTNNGIVEIIESKSSAEPTIINSVVHRVEDFIDISIQDLIFPSDETIASNRKSKKKDQECEYEVIRTSDGANMAIKLLVQFKITNAKDAVNNLKTMSRIKEHIEHVVRGDLQTAVKKSTSQDFTNVSKRPRQSDISDGDGKLLASAPSMSSQLDHLKEELEIHLKPFGIYIVNLNIEEAICLDKKRNEAADDASLKTAALHIKETTIERENILEQKAADQAARIAAIKAKQGMDQATLQAEADLKTAEAKANTKRAEYQAKAYEEYYKQEAQQKIIALTAETAATALLARSEAEKKAVIIKAEGEKVAAELMAAAIKAKGDAENAVQREREAIRVQALIKEMEGIAKAFGENPHYALFKSVEANATATAAALKGANMQIVLGTKPEEMMSAMTGASNQSALISQFANNPMMLFGRGPVSTSSGSAQLSVVSAANVDQKALPAKLA